MVRAGCLRPGRGYTADMRRLRWWHWLIFAVVFTVVVAFSFALLLFAPGIQRRVFLSSLEAPGRTVQVDHFSARMNGIEIRGLRWEDGGQRLAVHDIQARFRLLDALGSGPIVIEDVQLHGVHAEFDPQAGTREGEVVLRLPPDVTLERWSLDGDVSVPTPSLVAARIAISMRGEDTRPQATTRLHWSARPGPPAGETEGSAREIRGELAVRTTAAADNADLVGSVAGLLRAVADEALQRSTAGPAGSLAVD